MTRLLLFLLLLMTTSCKSQNQKTKNKIALIKKYDYLITIDVENGFWNHSLKFILNNLYIENYDSSYATALTKPLTLYSIRDHNSKSDTTQTVLSESQCDTIFNLTNNFFKMFVFINYDTAINNIITKQEVSDDSQATIELSYGGRILNATISSISNPTISTKEFDRLINFVEKVIISNKK